LGRKAVKITADTNILVRAVTGDNARQSKAAKSALERAEVVAMPIAALCELAWVLSRGYKHRPSEIAEAIRRLINGTTAAVDRSAAEAGLVMLDAGGDFADGVIAYDGNWLGADTFTSFDKNAVELLKAQGKSARLLP
jgi:predicted nucleic-acid-binding protein